MTSGPLNLPSEVSSTSQIKSMSIGPLPHTVWSTDPQYRHLLGVLYQCSISGLTPDSTTESEPTAHQDRSGGGAQSGGRSSSPSVAWRPKGGIGNGRESGRFSARWHQRDFVIKQVQGEGAERWKGSGLGLSDGQHGDLTDWDSACSRSKLGWAVTLDSALDILKEPKRAAGERGG